MALCCDSKTAPEEDEEEDMDGPLEDRSCTDIIFLLFFAAFLVGMVSRDIQTRETTVCPIKKDYLFSNGRNSL